MTGKIWTSSFGSEKQGDSRGRKETVKLLKWESTDCAADNQVVPFEWNIRMMRLFERKIIEDFKHQMKAARPYSKSK